MRYVEYEEMEKFLLNEIHEIDEKIENGEDNLTYKLHLSGVKIGYLNALSYLISKQKIKI